MFFSVCGPQAAFNKTQPGNQAEHYHSLFG